MRVCSMGKVMTYSLLVAGLVMTGCVGRIAREKGVPRCVVVWSEGTAPQSVYPHDINGAIVDGLKDKLPGWEIAKAGIADPDQGLPDALLNRADVLIWWGHKKHGEVKDELVARIEKRVKEGGMGFISLHSSHFAKINKRLMGAACSWGGYIGDSTTLTIKVLDESHPIAKGIPKEFSLTHNERYNDPYAVPPAKSVVFGGVADLKNGGRSTSQQGFCWDVGKGRMFYFQPGHETNPIFFNETIRTIMANAVLWAAPDKK